MSGVLAEAKRLRAEVERLTRELASVNQSRDYLEALLAEREERVRRLENERAAHDKTEAELKRLLDGLEAAWGVIANASGGDWTRESAEWQEAAARWRDGHWHPALSRWGEVRR